MKIITNECRVLKSMRKQEGFSQDHASHLCGYSRPSIGGRIKLNKERINHIISSYGFIYDDFEANLKKNELRDQMIDKCIYKIKNLDDFKLNVVKNFLESL